MIYSDHENYFSVLMFAVLTFTVVFSISCEV